MIHTLAEVPGSRPLLQHNTTQDSAAELFEGGSLADVAAAASAASPQQVRMRHAQALWSQHAHIQMASCSCMYLARVVQGSQGVTGRGTRHCTVWRRHYYKLSSAQEWQTPVHMHVHIYQSVHAQGDLHAW